MKISHIFLILFLLAFGVAFGYWIYSSWAFYFYSWTYVLAIPIVLTGCVFPLYAGIGLLINDIKKIKNGESTDLYEDNH